MDEVFYEAFDSLPRRGPGNTDSTLKAISLCKNIPDNPKILDIGCGTGIQTLELAKIDGADVIALDNFQDGLDSISENAEKAGLGSKIRCVNSDMFQMDFPPETFDIIWSEGSIFIVGFENGLRDWKKFLKPGGYCAVTEITWLKKDLPDEIKDYFDIIYPPMKDIDENNQIIKSAGYNITDVFVLPETAWWDDFYTPLQEKVFSMCEKYKGNYEAQKSIDNLQREIDMYEKYSDYYGYVFYIMQKV